jgi:ubiquinone/menaquinone biosynthesis C-methylase UbiE
VKAARFSQGTRWQHWAPPRLGRVSGICTRLGEDGPSRWRKNARQKCGPMGAPVLPRELPRPKGARYSLLQRAWDRKAATWDHGASPGLERVVQAVLTASDPVAGAKAVDLGCGTGSLALALVGQGLQVVAVDISPAMLRCLREKAALAGFSGLSCVICPIEQFDMPAESVDLVVSNYALHHLKDDDKALVVRRALSWLRPGGRLVIGDMMFGRGTSARDREVIATKIAVLARKGPPGWWRVVKNLVRFGLRVRERPVSMQTWESYLLRAGFQEVTVRPVVAEAGIVCGKKPSSKQFPWREVEGFRQD